jgi:polar amino acid transport system permease protein
MQLQPIGKSHALPIVDRLSRLPWWALVAGLLGALIAWSMLTSDEYQVIFRAISQGIVMTIYVTLIAYAAAVLLGLVCALGRVSKNVVI